MIRKHSVNLASLLGLMLALAMFAPARAVADEDDPPSRVARLAYSSGSVSFQPAGTDDWVTAVRNRPMTTGDKLWSDNDGRVEMQLDDSLIRISNNTGFSFLNLTDNVTQVRLTEGNLLINVRRMDNNDTYEIDTPNLAFTIQRKGVYRIQVNEGGDTTVVRVRSGEGEVTGGGTYYTVHANESGTFSGTDELYADIQGGGGNARREYDNQDSQRYEDRPTRGRERDYDEFDTWSSNRDRRWEHSASSRYVSSDVIGYEDLDDHGTWGQDQEYGNVWYPRTTVANWAPYHYGHWAYIQPWGYTWVDDEPWGFAPFHYGRWISVRGRWGWIPSRPRVEGVAYVRPVYAPALVAFVGGSNFSIGVSVGGGGGYEGGGGSVGWFPLGPREVYVPSYRTSRNYVNNVNVSNTNVNSTVVNNYYNTTVVNNNNTNVNSTVQNVKYVNQTVPGAVAATNTRAFTSAQSVSKNVVQVDQRQIATAPVRVVSPTIVPAKQAVLGTATAATVRPPAALQTRAVVAKAPPPPPPPAFEKQQEAIKSNGGKPLSVTQVRQIQPAAAAQAPAPVKIAPAAKAGVPGQGTRPPQAGQPQPGQPQNAQQNRPGQPNAQPGQPQPGAPTTQPAQGQTPQQLQQQQQQQRQQQMQQQQQNQNRPGQPTTNPVPPNSSTQPGNRPADRPGQPNANQPNNPNRPATPNNTPNTVQPGNRPADRPNDSNQNRPVTPNTSTQPGNRPADRPNGQPGTRPNDTNQNRPVTPNAPNAVQPGNRPADRPNTQPAERPNQPAARPNDRPADRPASQPATRPADRPADRPNANATDQKHQQEQQQLRQQQDQERQRAQQQQQQQKQNLNQQNADAAKKQQVNQDQQRQNQQIQQKQAQEQKQLQQKQQQEKQQDKPPKDPKDQPPADRP